MGRDARPPSAERVNRTKRLIRDAESAHQLSTSIREQSTVLKKVVEKDTERHQATVNELLQQKVAETESLARKLEIRIGACDAEMASLGDTRRQAQSLLDSRRVPLGIAEKRLRVRDDLPDREKLNDNVDRALRQEMRDLQMACDKLSGVIRNADDTMANLERNRAALVADFQDKRAALELDQNCLGVTITTAPGGFSPQKGARPAISAVLPQAVTQKSATLPEIWRKSTQQLLQTCQDAEKQSANLRTVIAKTIQQLSQANTTALKSTQTALKGKVRETGSLRSALDRRLQSVNDEIAALETERLHLTETLSTKEGPLETVKQRLAIRKQRPAREAVRDAVEEALEAELARLRNSVDSLNRKLDSVDRELRRLNEVKSQIEADLQDKTHALQLDKQCLDLEVADLPSPRRSYAGSVAMSATGSVPSTPRLPATPSRRIPLTAR